MDQATGLDAVEVEQSLGVPDPCDPTTFKSQPFVKTISNTEDVAGLNEDENYPGPIQWGKGNLQQGYPYEGYVSGLLAPAGYEQTVRPFTAFDQWNGSIAVSDKTLNTEATSYQNTPSKITVKMVQAAEKMLHFLQSRSVASGPNFTQQNIESYSFYMAVPDGTTDPQWQAICQGYQLMKTICSVKGVNIVINSVDA
ncbi:MAG: hypothetical protein ACRYFY_06780 [Janthinobacterium lividum]